MNMLTPAVAVGLWAFAAPPEPDEGVPEVDAAALTGAERSTAPDEPSSPAVDNRGEPVLEFSDEGEAAPDVDFADETPPPDTAGVEFAEDPPEDEGLEYLEEDRQSVPPPEAVARQSEVDLSADADPKADPNYASPQRFALEIKFGPYLPEVDNRYDGPGLGPYAEIFGETNDAGVANDDPRLGLMAKLGFEWQFYNLGGPFLLGTSVGFFQDRADALLANPDPNANSVRSSADRVRFNVVPLSLDVGYRFELLADRYRVPLVPYVKGGLAYGFWWSRGGASGVTENDAGVKGRGGSIGWQASLGLMLRLDFLERGTARELDRATGINHTYIFGEYQLQGLDGFGGALEKVSVGDDTFYLGLAIEF